MKKFLALLIAIACMAAATLGQTTGYVEVQTTHADGEVGTMENVWAQGPLVREFGWFAWGSTSETWGQTYAGLTYSPIPIAQVGFGAGLESADYTRFGMFAWVGVPKASALFIYEDGSAPWHRLTAAYYLYDKPGTEPFSKLGLGGMNERGLGFGPYAELRILKQVTGWGSVMFDDGAKVALLGGKLTF